MNKYIELYIDSNCNTDNTREAYTNDLNNMLDFIGKEITDIDQFDLLEWKKSLAHLSSATQARRIGSVKRFFTFLRDSDILTTNPAATIKPPKIVNKEEEDLTYEEVQRLIECGKNPRDKAIVAMMASTGLRVSELCSIKLEDIDEDDNIKILGKGSKWRQIHLNNKVKGYINEYLKVRKNNDCNSLFINNSGNSITRDNISKTLKTLGKRAGVKNVHPHAFRHYFCTAMLDNNIPINQISLVVGHSNIQTTMRYARVRDKKGMVEKLMNIEVC